MMRPSRTHEPSGSSPKPRSDITPPTCTNLPSTSACSHIYIEVLPPSVSHVSSHHTDVFSQQEDFRTLGPRPLRNIDPTLTFMSHTQRPCFSSFDVLKDGILVHSEISSVEWCPTPSASSQTSFLCRTNLVPKFWPRLCECDGEFNFSSTLSSFWRSNNHQLTDPAAYTISHDIRAQRDPSTSSNTDVVLSVIYHFIDHNSPSPYRSLSPESVGESLESDGRSLSGDLSVSQDLCHTEKLS